MSEKNRIFTEGIGQEQADVELPPGTRLFVEDSKGNKVQIGFTNCGDIIVHSSDDKGGALQVQPVASNCVYLRTGRM